MSHIDKRIQVNTIIENQLPDFVLDDFPNAVEFLKQYYISQEFQGGPSDLISNFDQYLKADNLVPEVIVGVTTATTGISTTDTTINVSSTKGFPSEYGLLKIDNEIISYTGIPQPPLQVVFVDLVALLVTMLVYHPLYLKLIVKV